MRIRPETDADRTAVHAVNAAAFETPAEANLVETLRAKSAELISLVADVDGVVVGHILFSPVSLTEQAHLSVMGLGPMAVAPQHQRKGIGSALVREGLERSAMTKRSLTPDNQFPRTVMDNAPSHTRQRAAAESGRYATINARG